MTTRLLDVPEAISIRRGPRARGRRPTRRVELDLWEQGVRRVVGVDEVGRGALAGPVVSAAVTLAPGARPRWLGALRDSKQLTPRQRSLLAPQIKASALDWGVGWASSAEVDRFGILPATRLSMHRALAALRGLPDFVLVDGRDRHEFDCGYAAITRGDAQVASIAAASVVAKVARDAWMEAIDGRHAAYGFATNRGYATADHLSALEEAGPCEEHRRSFAPVRLAEGDAPVVAGLPLVY